MDTRTYRLTRSHFRLGIVGVILYSAVAIASAIGMYFEAPPDRKLLALVLFPTLWTPFIGLSVWLILAYRRESITTEEARIVATGMLSERVTPLGQITRALWVPTGRGCKQPRGPYKITLTTPSGRLRIWFRNFHFTESKRLVAYLRSRIDATVQEGWHPSFDEYLHREYSQQEIEEGITFVRKLRRRLLAWPVAIGLFGGLVSGLSCSFTRPRRRVGADTQ